MLTFKEFLTEARLTKTEQELVNRLFYGKETSTQQVSFFKGSHIRGTRSQSGKSEFEAAKKLADKGVIEIVSTDNSGMSQTLSIKLKDKSATNLSLSKKQLDVLGSVVNYMTRIFRSDKQAMQLPSVKMTGATRKHMNTLETMGLVFDSTLGSGSYVLTKEGAKVYQDNFSSLIRGDTKDMLNDGNFGQDFVKKYMMV